MRSRPIIPTQSNRRGAALVEMALVAPLFFILLFGIIEFGRGMQVSNMVANAAREGARLAVLDGTSNADVEDAIKSYLVSTTGITNADISIKIVVTPAPGNPDPGNEVSGATARDLINVIVEVPFNKVSYLPGNTLGGKNLVGNSAMRHE